MTCEELIEFLMEYVDGELAAAAKGRFDEHLDRCPECNDYLASYRETVRLGKMICQGDDALPDDIPEDLVEAILDARRAGL